MTGTQEKYRLTHLAPPLPPPVPPNTRPAPLQALPCLWPAPAPAPSLFPAPQVQLLRGERYLLMDNTDQHTWVVQGPDGETKRAPAACFCIPAPDPDAVARASKWVCLGILRSRRETTGPAWPSPGPVTLGVGGKVGERGETSFSDLLLVLGWRRSCRP